MAKKKKTTKSRATATKKSTSQHAPVKKAGVERRLTRAKAAEAADEQQQNDEDAHSKQFPIVGIGASAGGLTALKEFFARMPEDSGLAFVVVMHLSPEHKSHLTEVLQPHVKMPVQQVSATMSLERNHVYVIPPNANLDTIDTHLRLSELEKKRQERAPINHFFRTLAKSHGGDAIGLILTGTGSDGTLGIREIKEHGGLAVVQDPYEAEFDGMPQSAIASGLADLVLPLARIPEALLRYTRVRPKLRVPQEDEPLDSETSQQIHKLFALLRARTGRDFSRYKRATILRRMQRRMQLRQLEELSDYLKLLREQPEEAEMLADDLLITVTSFFRDSEVFDKLKKDVIPQLFQGKSADDDIRIWSVGCATGEEAYSLAILLVEEAMKRETPPRLQIFASDLHEHSLKRARDGFFPGDVETDVSPERMKRFFVKENGGYRIRKEIREMVIFAPHNLFADPPFSRLDLISCRNVLIYIQRDVQRDVVELFHYSLRPDGVLLLGTSETVEGDGLFRLEDKKRCIYRKRNVPAPEPRLPVFPLSRPRLPGEAARAGRPEEPVAYGTLHQRMVERYAPPSALVNSDDKIVHLSEHAGRYLVHPGGQPTASIFKLIREELRVELRSTLHEAREHRKASRSKPILVQFNGDAYPVVLHVRPALEPNQDGFALIIFDEREPAEGLSGSTSRRHGKEAGKAAKSKPRAREQELEAELELTKQRLQALIEEYETSQEEMKASNEEMQSTNEELRSTMEELETSKEELQSMNEELQTVNQENRHKVEELAQLSSDLQNLLSATDIATLFLDRHLRIMRFTPKVSELFNVRTTDRSRPITDFTHRLGYRQLQNDAKQVLDRLTPIEREIEDESGRWYLTRVMPYRSTTERIEGVVITFIEITARKAAENEIRRAKERAERIIETLPEPLLVLTPDLKVKSANAAFYEHFRVERGQTLGQSVYELGNSQWNIPALRTLLEDVLPDNNVFSGYEVRHEFDALGYRVMLLNGRRLDNLQLILLGIHDITERHEAQRRLLESEGRLHELVARLLRSADLPSALDEVLAAAIDITDAAMGTVQLWNVETESLEIVAQRDLTQEYVDHFRTVTLEENSGSGRAARSRERVVIEDVLADELYEPHRDVAAAAGYRAVQSTPLISRGGEVLGVLSTHYPEPHRPSERDMRMVDLYARQAADFIEHVRNREAAQLADQRKDEFLATLAHELRNPLAPIYTGLQLLKMEDDKLGALEKVHGMMERQTCHLIALVDDLLDVSRITRGKLELKKCKVDLAEVIQTAVEAVTPLIDSAGTLLTVAAPEEQVFLDADPYRLTQVVSNLLNNAAKFTPQGGKIWLSSKLVGDEVVITVKDTGVGLPPDMLDSVFEMFMQVNRELADGDAGLGIGLTLVKSLVELHGGTIQAQSEGPNKGCEFIVRLPVASARPEQESIASPATGAASAGHRVLVVDDNGDAAGALAMLLQTLGNEVRTATDGTTAIAVAEEFRPTVVLLDIGMPVLNGYEVARRIREQRWGREMTLVALTGWGQEEERRKSHEAGFDAHLLKPAGLAVLTELLASIKPTPVD